MDKIKTIYNAALLFIICTVIIFLLNGNSGSKFLFQTQNNSETEYYPSSYLTDTFKCATMEYYNKMVKKDKGYENRLRELEVFTKNYIKNLKPAYKSIVKVPVVIHVVYNTPEQNISNAEVQSQIDILNEDYRRLNADTSNTPLSFKHLGGDPQIEFVLAKRDPMGNPTIGITRTQTSVIEFNLNGFVKFDSTRGHNIWDRDKYLNFWVCNFYYTGGYSQFPGGDPATDGIVMHHAVFGTIRGLVNNLNKGRVATHEVGHWFNLIHIFGESYCGNDSVDDTPTQQTANFGCPAFPHITCNNGPNGDMFMNYMDFTFDNCKNIFTIGQANRMNAAIYGARSGLLNSNGGTPVSGFPIAHFRSDKMTINYGQSANFFDESGGIPTNWQWKFEGGIPAVSNQKNPTVIYPNGGFYSVKLKIANSFGTDSVNYVNYIKVLGANMRAFSIVYPPSDTFIHTSQSDTAKSTFTWERTSSHPSIRYKWKIRKAGTFTDFSYNSNNNGSDSVITLKDSFLDSLALMFEPNSDTVRCIWRVFSYNGIDSLSSQNAKYIFIIRSTVGIKIVSLSVPDKFNLFQNYPNPFNPETKIKFSIPSKVKRETSDVKLVIYDILGKEITTLVDQQLKPGTYEVTFDGSKLPGGVYFYRIKAGDFSGTKKMLMIK